MGRDLRLYARSTQLRLVLGGLGIVIVVGGGLVWWLYGPQAAAMALLCVGVALAPAVLILVALLALQWVSRTGHK